MIKKAVRLNLNYESIFCFIKEYYFNIIIIMQIVDFLEAENMEWKEEEENKTILKIKINGQGSYFFSQNHFVYEYVLYGFDI